MTALLLVIKTIGSLLASAFVLRALSHWVHLSPYNPISQFVNAVTDWAVKPLRKAIAPTRNADWASVLGAFLVAVITALLIHALFGRMPTPGGVVLRALLWLVEWSLQLLIGMLILQAVLSWVNPHAPLAPALNQLTGPFLRPLQKIIPPIGGVDLSPMALMLVVYVILELVQNAAFGY